MVNLTSVDKQTKLQNCYLINFQQSPLNGLTMNEITIKVNSVVVFISSTQQLGDLHVNIFN